MPATQAPVLPTHTAVAGVWEWAATGGLDFEVQAGDFGVVAAAGVIPRMDITVK